MYSKRLTDNDYRSLIECRSVGEAADKLKKLDAYSGILSTVPTLNITRSRLEVLLQSKVYDDILSLSKYQKAVGDEFYKYFMYEYDIMQLRNCISCLKTKTESYMQRLPDFYDEKSCLDLYRLARTQTIDEIVTLCEKTPYHDCIKQVKRIYEETGDLTRSYVPFYAFLHSQFVSLLGGKRKVKNKKGLVKLYNTVRDLEMLKILRRVKRFSTVTQLSPKFIQLDITELSDNDVKQIFDAKNVKEFDTIISRTVYAPLISETDDDDFEKRADEFLMKECKKTIMYSSDADECMFAYVLLKKQEVQNIIHIIESVRYKLPKDEIDKFVVQVK